MISLCLPWHHQHITFPYLSLPGYLSIYLESSSLNTIPSPPDYDGMFYQDWLLSFIGSFFLFVPFLATFNQDIKFCQVIKLIVWISALYSCSCSLMPRARGYLTSAGVTNISYVDCGDLCLLWSPEQWDTSAPVTNINTCLYWYVPHRSTQQKQLLVIVPDQRNQN